MSPGRSVSAQTRNSVMRQYRQCFDPTVESGAHAKLYEEGDCTVTRTSREANTRREMLVRLLSFRGGVSRFDVFLKKSAVKVLYCVFIS